ncbi:MAG: hypothetical protein Sylvanvirus17_5 [Sylvanvirus sp.]|uniref:Uncharacterized protein n=1 Tax=Sylvanvirus sp. TaxID=2487774 RepID=A0A3G5AII5_9VIRU|nr:MAG: hypothetical protein Sylvanvirus17_5 [Sylvanvirus sp.]
MSITERVGSYFNSFLNTKSKSDEIISKVAQVYQHLYYTRYKQYVDLNNIVHALKNFKLKGEFDDSTTEDQLLDNGFVKRELFMKFIR